MDPSAYDGHPRLTAVDGGCVRDVISGHEVLAELAGVLSERLPLVSPADPRFGHLRDLQRLLAAQALSRRLPRGR
jgi:hypothetical protein